MKNYCVSLFLMLLMIHPINSSDRRSAYRVVPGVTPTQAGPARATTAWTGPTQAGRTDDGGPEAKEADASRRAQAAPGTPTINTPEEAIAAWLYQQQEQLRMDEQLSRERELLEPRGELFEQQRYARKNANLSDLGAPGALHQLGKTINEHLSASPPVFPGTSLSFDLTAHTPLTPQQVAIAADGHTIATTAPYKDLATGEAGTTIRIHDLFNNAAHEEFHAVAPAGDTISVTHLAFSPHRPYLAAETIAASSLEENQSRTLLFNLATSDGSPQSVQHPSADHLLFSPDGSTMVIAYGRTVLVYNIDEPDQAPKKLQTPKNIAFLAFAADGKTLAANQTNNALASWDTENWKPIKRKKLKARNPQEVMQLLMHSPFIPVFDPTMGVNTHVSSPNGVFVAAGLADGSIRLWNNTTKNSQGIVLRAENSGPRSPIVGVGFWPDSRHITSVSANGTVILWNLGAIENRRDVASKLLTDFLKTLDTHEKRVAVGTLIKYDGPNLATLLFLLKTGKLQAAQQLVTDIRPRPLEPDEAPLLPVKRDFTGKKLSSPNYQAYLFQHVIGDYYYMLDK